MPEIQSEEEWDKARIVRAFVDGIDWQHELGEASDGTKLYPSADCAKRYKTCIEKGGCGIVEVEVRFVRWVEPQKLLWDHDNHEPKVADTGNV